MLRRSGIATDLLLCLRPVSHRISSHSLTDSDDALLPDISYALLLLLYLLNILPYCLSLSASVPFHKKNAVFCFFILFFFFVCLLLFRVINLFCSVGCCHIQSLLFAVICLCFLFVLCCFGLSYHHHLISNIIFFWLSFTGVWRKRKLAAFVTCTLEACFFFFFCRAAKERNFSE